MHRGYIKLWRKTLYSSVWSDIDLWRTWCCCLMSASHKEKDVLLSKTGTSIKIKPGQFVTGRESFYRLMFPKKRKKNPHPITVWRWLEALKMMQNLHIETHNKYSIITIINWDVYQQDNCIDTQQIEHNLHQSCTQRAPIVHTIKNVKNVKNVKETPPTSPSKSKIEFDLFWAEYPKKVGRIDAQKAWIKSNGGRPSIEAVIEKICQLKKSDQWTRDGGQYIPNPATWIRRGGWDDQVSVEIKKSKTPWLDRFENEKPER